MDREPVKFGRSWWSMVMFLLEAFWTNCRDVRMDWFMWYTECYSSLAESFQRDESKFQSDALKEKTLFWLVSSNQKT